MNDIGKRYQKAARSALNILDYADNTERKLREKLARKGYSRDETDYAVEYAKKSGYLNEKRHLENAVYTIANHKLYGKRRIRAELYQKGFRIEDIDNIDFSEIDFASNCAERIKKTVNRYDDKNKLQAALLRYGFSYEDIKSAYRIIKEEKYNNE